MMVAAVTRPAISARRYGEDNGYGFQRENGMIFLMVCDIMAEER